MEKIWKGRINKDTDSNVEKFTSSLNVDKSLYMYDVIGTIAHVIGLKKIGIITDNELKKIAKGLEEVTKKIESEEILISDQYEDIHSLIECELEKVIGEFAKKIHTGRSRNDQIVLDEKLFIKDAIINTIDKVLSLQENIIKIAQKEIDIIIPAYTHMQKAQPVLLSHYLLSFFEKLTGMCVVFLEILKTATIFL